MQSDWKKDYARYKDFFLNIWKVYNTKPSLKVYTELILSIVTVIVFGLFAIKPTILTIIELNKEIKSKEVTINKMDSKIKNLKTASSVLQEQSADIGFIDEAVPSSSDPEQLLSSMEVLANNNSVNLIAESITDIVLVGKRDKESKKKDYQALPNNASEVPFSISVSGDYPNIKNFLASIENLRRPVKIDSITISSSATEDSQIIVAAIVGRVPYIEIEK